MREKGVRSCSCGTSFQSQHSARRKPAGPVEWDTVLKQQQNDYDVCFQQLALSLAETYTCLAWMFIEYCVSLNWRRDFKGGRIAAAPCLRGFYQHTGSFASGPSVRQKTMAGACGVG